MNYRSSNNKDSTQTLTLEEIHAAFTHTFSSENKFMYEDSTAAWSSSMAMGK